MARRTRRQRIPQPDFGKGAPILDSHARDAVDWKAVDVMRVGADVDALGDLAEHFARLAATAEADELRDESPPRRSVVGEPKQIGVVTYQLERVRCGKARCKCYTGSEASMHGPYWYAYWRVLETGKMKSQYIGKTFRELAFGTRSKRDKSLAFLNQPGDVQERMSRTGEPAPKKRKARKFKQLDLPATKKPKKRKARKAKSK